MASELKPFIQRILGVTPRYNDLFSNGVPGEGASNTGADPAQNLQRMALQFGHAYRDTAVDGAEVQRLAAELEGALMVAATFEIMSDSNADELVTELHELLSARNR